MSMRLLGAHDVQLHQIEKVVPPAKYCGDWIAPPSEGAPGTFSLSDATRAGILVTVAAKAWGVIYFLIAAGHVRREPDE